MMLLLWAQASHALEPVTLHLKWIHQFQFAGYYMALEKGFYREAGLAVTLRPNGYNGAFVSPVNAVLKGDAHYGISNSGLIRDYADGKPVVALAATLQHSAVSWLVLERPDIQNLHDLVDKKLMTVFPLSESVELLAPFRAEGVESDRLNLVQTTFNLEPLIQHQVDAYDAYVTNEPFELEQRGIAYRLIDPRAYGIDFYGDVLFTSQSEVQLHPERVSRFRTASLRGWHYAMEHIEETIAVIQRQYAREKSAKQLRFEAKSMTRLMQPELIDIGHMNPGRWQRIAEIQLAKSQLTNLDLEPFLYSERRINGFISNYLRLLGGLLLFSLLLLIGIVWYYRLNRRLKLEIQARQRAEEALIQLAETDPLTGLHNLRYMSQTLNRELAGYQRHGQAFCLLMLDIDHFKAVNDAWGHPIGDRVLAEFALCLTTHCRCTDEVARIGGEEFLILLRDVKLEQARLIAEKLRQQVAKLKIVTPDDHQFITLTCSIGITQMQAESTQSNLLLSQADKALYQAKALGRNRVEIYQPAT